MAQSCRGGVRRAKAQVEQDLAGDVKGNQVRFCKCRGEKERPRRESRALASASRENLGITL